MGRTELIPFPNAELIISAKELEYVKQPYAQGHTPGCMASTVKTREGTIVLSGDAGKFAKEFLTRRKEDFMIFGPPEEIERSLQRILEIADVVIPGDDRPFRVVDDNYVAWEDSIGLEYMIL